ncbi:stalk domain-containing protein [Paenibacillus sp. WQ 127069]|uniref:Stalk domain-containing protein n=1 Tax=Paenibacillus baimaensis TaxID=2982185 RepID=A0ABT2U928_9BACL|nr:stalk domain-containing protein [Paenibacillus sp. WQ 127069]MCU6791047.1 stalk domain-containing protein [Paenibacillus sp. WQ 127069]
MQERIGSLRIWKKSAILSTAVFLSSITWAVHANAEGNTSPLVSGHNPEEIMSKWEQYRPKFNGNPFIEQPLLVPPYTTGRLNAEFIQDGVNMANYARYLAGLPDNLTADPALNDQAQHGAVLLSVRDKGLSHTPDKPSTMDDSFYKIGYKSTSSSNLYSGATQLYSTVIGYMSDSDMSNIDRLGHRRWILNPPLRYTGFGLASGNTTFSPMQVFDKSGTAAFSMPYIAWPSPGAFPTNAFKRGDAWSITLNPAQYKTPSADQVKVVLKRKGDGKVWTFDQKDRGIPSDPKSFANRNYFNVETSNFGIANCIIFRPALVGTIENNDEYEAQITGIQAINGAPATITYTVRFFDIPDKADQAAFLSEWSKPSDQKANLNPVAFQSADFEKMIRTILEKPQEPVTDWDLSRITALDIDYSTGDIAKDAGLLRKFTSMERLQMFHMKDADISFLSELRSLRDLTVRNQNLTINGIDALKQLPNLKILYLQGDVATSQLTALLDPMKSLQKLDIWNDSVTDLNFVPHMANLQRLSVGGKALRDISRLDKAPLLRELGLHSKAITDYSSVNRLGQLETLELNSSGLSELTWVSTLTHLKSMDITDNAVSNLLPLSSLTSLETLYASNNRIQNVAPLASLPNLSTLYLSSNGIKDISPFMTANMKWKYLNLNYNFLDVAPGSPPHKWLEAQSKKIVSYDKQQQLKLKSLRLADKPNASVSNSYMLVNEAIAKKVIAVYNDYSEKTLSEGVNWESSRPDTIDVEGDTLVAKKKGYAQIKIKADGFDQSISVTVLDKHNIDSYKANVLSDASLIKMNTMILLAVNSSSAYVQGEKKTLQAKPLIDNDSTLLPVRFVSENLGVQVTWDADTQTATLTGSGGSKITITVDSMQMKMNEAIVDLPVSAKIINGSTYLPLRVLCEALGKKVSFSDGVIIIGERDYEQDHALYDELIALYGTELR